MLLNVLYEPYKFRKHKRAVEHSPFLKKIAACQSVCVCEIVKLSGFERPQKNFNNSYTVVYLRLNLSPHLTTNDHIWSHLTKSGYLFFCFFWNFFLNKIIILFFFQIWQRVFKRKVLRTIFTEKRCLLVN